VQSFDRRSTLPQTSFAPLDPGFRGLAFAVEVAFKIEAMSGAGYSLFLNLSAPQISINTKNIQVKHQVLEPHTSGCHQPKVQEVSASINQVIEVPKLQRPLVNVLYHLKFLPAKLEPRTTICKYEPPTVRRINILVSKHK
jgi:hypothetical protein